ncbi:Major facilitator superfamily MFS_1 [Nostocoides japonicum T1-X7]|uniref:Major facilitator superfamily MFS_1 n=1 Tax=Nostocoides japonicum T1-X7 TaxID=1194083 RepID=A0A077M671_9MICO|nr:MFS transporter [Tetrasphaera japonica]CCH79540.1 Major facilitator superfamily MFS_1 [Tetrasphaera japonica T1-X7]
MTTLPSEVDMPSARWWNRELHHYPVAKVRYTSLTVVVLATIALYYQLYLSGGVAIHIIEDYGLSFRWFVILNVVALAVAAVAAHFGGITDRIGRANVITIGLVVVGLLCAVAVPLCSSRWSFAVVFCILNAAEGVILVATPAVVRDFSPQLGRASAMGFWTMGPVLGSLVVTAVVGSGATSSWKTHYVIAGICGLVVAVISVPLLKELAPALRDQVMVEEKDRALLEARVKGIDVEASLAHPSRQMFKPDIILSSIAISVFLLFYIGMVAFGPTYFEVNFGYSETKANSVLVWAWAFNVGGLILAGLLSDRILVRKPLMLAGSIVQLVMLIVFITKATRPETAFSTFALVFAISFFFGGMAYVAWMAAFTETVERRNPALTATGLAVWGLIIRIIFAAFILVAPFLVNTVNTIVDHGATVAEIAAGEVPQLTADQNKAVAAIAKDPTIVTKVQSLATQYAEELKTAATIDAATSQALATNPRDPATLAKAVGEISSGLSVTPAEATARLVALARVPAADLTMIKTYGPPLTEPVVFAKLQYLKTYGPQVQQALKDGPHQWQRYWSIAAVGAVVFIPMIWLMAGYWTPAQARAALRSHETEVEEELAKTTS